MNTAPFSIKKSESQNIHEVFSDDALAITYSIIESYIIKLNSLVLENSRVLGTMTLDAMATSLTGQIKDLASEIISHELFFRLLQRSSALEGTDIYSKIINNFGLFDNYKKAVIAESTRDIGPGWIWTVLNKENGEISILFGSNSYNPISRDLFPLLCISLWEHPISSIIIRVLTISQ